jgi:hypothetical protein
VAGAPSLASQASVNPEVKQLRLEADLWPLSIAEVKNEWSYISIPHYAFTTWYIIKHDIHVHGKGKGKVVPVRNQAPRHEGVLREWKYRSTHSLTSAIDEGEWPASRPGRFTPRERAPGIHGIGGWVSPRAVLDAVVKRKIPSHRRESSPRTPIGGI